MNTAMANVNIYNIYGECYGGASEDDQQDEDMTYIDLDERDDDEIMEPVMEKIKDMVAQMPQETQQIDAVFEAIQPKHHKNDFEDITADFNEIPIFDKVSDIKTTEKKSLNDKLKSGGLTIGLNDKLAFIKHLFDSKNEDYDRVISQLNTIKTEKRTALGSDITKTDSYPNRVPTRTERKKVFGSNTMRMAICLDSFLAYLKTE